MSRRNWFRRLALSGLLIVLGFVVSGWSGTGLDRASRVGVFCFASLRRGLAITES